MDPFDGMETFARVVEAGGFTAAAQQTGGSKSSMSETVRRLEARLGVRLLERTTRRVQPTEAGRAFYARCRRALDEAAAAAQEAQALQEEAVGRLRVAAPEGMCRLHLVPLLPELLAAHPALQVEFVEGAAPVDLVEAGLDLAIRVAAQLPAHLVARRLATSRVVIVASPGYLARHGRPEHPQDVVRHRCIGYSPLFWSREWRFQNAAGPVVAPVDPVLLVNGAESVRAAAIGGVGLGALPSWAVADALASGELVRVLEDWDTPPSGVWAVYPSGRLMPVKVKRFVDHVAKALRQRLETA